MPLPVKTVDINTATLPDFKNVCLVGPQKRTVGFAQQADDGATFFALGDTQELVGGRLSAAALTLNPQALAVFNLQRVGSPTFTVRCKAYADSADAPDFTQLVAISFPIASSSIPTRKTGTNPNFASFLWITPFTPVSGNWYWFVLEVSAMGSSSNYIKVWANDTGSVQTALVGSKASGGSWVTAANDISRMMSSYYYNDEHVICLADKTNNKLLAFKSAAGNINSWAQYASNNVALHPANKSFAVQNTMSGLLKAIPELIAFGPFDTGGGGFGPGALFIKLTIGAPGAWGDHPTISINTTATHVTGPMGIAPFGGGVRPNDTEAVYVYQGPTETNMGAPRRRIKLRYFAAGAWSAEFDVVGSANTPDSTLPGSAVHYDLRWAGVDENGDCHIIYSHDTNNTLQYRKFKTNNTFTTINTINGAVASATANYPVGNPCFSNDGTDWFIAVPYLDSTSNTLKAARCKTTITETSGNWTLTQVVAASAETTGSIPAIFVPDSFQGNKINCWRVKPTTKTLAYTHDSGSNTWVPETDWRSGQVVGGVAGFAAGFGVDLAYLEEGTTPDEIRYDHL